jgi:hypothetical protein
MIKRILLGLAILAAVFSIAPGSPATATPVDPCAGGTLGYWPMDEGTGTVVHDICNGYNGTIFGGVSWGTDVEGPYLQFSPGDGRRVEVNAPALSQNTAITVELRMQAVANDSSRVISQLLKPDGSSGAQRWTLKHEGRQLEVWGPTGSDNTPESFGSFPGGLDNWTHVAFQINGNQVWLYYNGVLTAQRTLNFPQTLRSLAAITEFGSMERIFCFGGKIQYVRISSGVRSDFLLTRVPTDSTPPNITFTVTPPANANGWNNTSVTVDWTVSDPETGISSTSGCGATTLTTETAGTTLTCSATNGAGLSNSQSVTVQIDITTPVTTITSAVDGNGDPVGSGGSTLSPNITFSFIGNDLLAGIAGFECSLDGGTFSACTNGISFTSLAVGSHTVQVRATDLADNLEPIPATFNWTINKPPLAVAGTSLDTNGMLELNGSLSTDPGGTIVSYIWLIEGEASPRMGEIVSIADLIAGEYRVDLTVTDDDGSTDTVTMLFGVPIIYEDTIPPARPNVQINENPIGSDDSVMGDPGDVEGLTTVTIYADANLTTQIDSTTANPDGSFSPISIGDNAISVVFVTATDEFGNESLAQELENVFVIPKVIGTTPAQGATGVRRNTRIIITFSELMDPNTTANAFSIDPLVLGTIRVKGSELIFTPDGKLTANTTFIVTVAASATDQAGNPLGSSYSLTFTTGNK